MMLQRRYCRMSAPFCRKALSNQGLLREARWVFATIPDSPNITDYLEAFRRKRK
jgi:hypothetical protein